MPPALKRRLVTLAAAASLVLCIATVALWVRSYRSESSVSCRINGDRYTLRIENGRITFNTPPRAPAPAAAAASGAGASPLALVRELSNSRVDWYVHREPGGFLKRGPGRTVLVAAGGAGTMRALGTNPAYGSTKFSMAELAGPLLRALELPDAFAAGHVVLADHLKTDDDVTVQDLSDDKCLATVDGLRVTLRATRRYIGNHRPNTVMFRAEAQIPSEQLPAIRDQWHRRLDVQRWSMSAAWVVLVTAGMPALLAVEQVRRHRRRRANRCPDCGYDLRATPDRCPECGAAPAAPAAP
jgi:hypothetical protein